MSSRRSSGGRFSIAEPSVPQSRSRESTVRDASWNPDALARRGEHLAESAIDLITTRLLDLKK